MFQLHRSDTGALVHRYPTEGAALAFIREVIRIGGHNHAACFALDERESEGKLQRVAEGVELIRRALQDLALWPPRQVPAEPRRRSAS